MDVDKELVNKLIRDTEPKDWTLFDNENLNGSRNIVYELKRGGLIFHATEDVPDTCNWRSSYFVEVIGEGTSYPVSKNADILVKFIIKYYDDLKLSKEDKKSLSLYNKLKEFLEV